MEATEDIFLAFDVYGTLLSTDSIAKQLAAHFGEQKAASLAAAWRKYQLEYSWRLNSMRTFLSLSYAIEFLKLHCLRAHEKAILTVIARPFNIDRSSQRNTNLSRM